MTWAKVGDKELIEKGATYRSTYYLKMPYTDTLADLIRRAVDTIAPVLRLRGQLVQGISTYRPDETEQTAGGRYMRWRIVVTWQAV